MSATESELIFSVTTEEFPTKVLEKSKEVPVIVDFWAPWCGPCRALAPILERLVNERKGEVLLAKVNTDEEQSLAMEYRIEGIPAVIGFKGGRPVIDFVGLRPEAEIRRYLDALSPTEADKEASRAANLEKVDPAAAEKIYRDALAHDHNLESAILGLARLQVAQNNLDEADELLENIGPGSENADEGQKLTAQVWLQKAARDLPDEAALKAQVAADDKNARARLQLGTRLAIAGKHQEALDLLLAAGERDPKLAANEVRETMVRVFHLIDDRSPMANEYRKRLSLLLY